MRLGGSGRLEDEPAPDEAAVFCLNIIAVPSELTRTRIPLFGATSAGVAAGFEKEDIADEGVGVDGDSGMGVARTGRPKLGAAPEEEGREVLAILKGLLRGGVVKG